MTVGFWPARLPQIPEGQPPRSLSGRMQRTTPQGLLSRPGSTTACSAKRNGSTPPAQERRRPITGGKRSAVDTPPVTAVEAPTTARARLRWAPSRPIHSGCMTWLGTLFRGLRTAITTATDGPPQMEVPGEVGVTAEPGMSSVEAPGSPVP